MREEGRREKRQERRESVGGKRKKGRETWTDDRTEKEKRRERSGRRRDDEYITYGGESRFESCAGSIVLLREAGRSLSLSHAALIAHRSLIYRVGGRNAEKKREREGNSGREGGGRERKREPDSGREREMDRQEERET